MFSHLLGRVMLEILLDVILLSDDLCIFAIILLDLELDLDGRIIELWVFCSLDLDGCRIELIVLCFLDLDQCAKQQGF